MKSFEQEVKDFFTRGKIRYFDYSQDYDRLDFKFTLPKTNEYFYLDVKEKRQKYNMNNWDTDIPEQHLFIVDDLAARKLLYVAPNSALLIRDNLRQKYFLFLVIDLFLINKKRINRKINKNEPMAKGKWLLDLRKGVEVNNIDSGFKKLEEYVSKKNQIYKEIKECYGHYFGEKIGVGGIVRRAEHWETDVKSTR